MVRRSRYKPGPKSCTRSRFIAERGTLGDESSFDSGAHDSSSQQSDDNLEVTKKQNSNLGNKSQMGDQLEFCTPEVDTNATDYGLEFTTSNIQNPSPPRCSTLRSAVNSQEEQLSTDNTKKTREIEKPASAFSKHSQMKKQNPKKVTKQQATQSKKAGTENTKDQTTNAATTSETVRKPRKQLTPLQADRRFWKEVKDLQNCTSFLIPMLPFARLVRELVYQASTEVTKITPTAMEALQASSELYMTQRMQDAYMLTLHRGRVTLDVKDMQLINYLKLNVQ